MNAIEFQGKTYYPLRGLNGYHAATDGEVISTKFKTPRLLKHGAKTLSHGYHLCINGKVINVTRIRIAYMVQENCTLESINGLYVGESEGRYFATEKHREAMKPKHFDPLTDIAALRAEIDLLEAFYISKDIMPLKKYLEAHRGEFVEYGIKSLYQGAQKVHQVIDETLSEFYMALYEGRVTRGILAYFRGIMRKRVVAERKQRAQFRTADYLLDNATYGIA